jgi:hypothetical protein
MQIKTNAKYLMMRILIIEEIPILYNRMLAERI